MKKLLIILFFGIINVFCFKVSANESYFNIVSSTSDFTFNSLLSSKSSNFGLFNSDRIISYVYTPNGSAVMVYEYTRDFSDSVKHEYDLKYDSKFPQATRLGSTTQLYNCHSYAWYSSTTSNKYWMDDPSPYYNDGSYEEVQTPKSGDIICYFDDNETTNNFSDDVNLHSGVVINYNSSLSPNGICENSNQVMVRSKWGSLGLYEHRGDYCPYVQKYGGKADYIKFYRHFHQYVDHYCSCGAYTTMHDYHAPHTWKNYTHHLSHCGCGSTKELPHAVSSDAFQNHKDRYAPCLLCGGLAEIGFVNINHLSYKTKFVTANGSFILPNDIIVLTEEDIKSYLNGSIIFSAVS